MKLLNQTSHISINNDLFKKFKINLNKKYYNDYKTKLYKIIINSILSNRKTHLVTTFKDFLLYEDYSEFLKRFYNRRESFVRLKKISKYFKETSVLYPNYSPLIESKYIYSNIIRKQVVINKQENYKLKNYMIKKHYKDKNEDDNKKGNIFFTSIIYKEILNESESFISLLFGMEYKDKRHEKRKNDKEKDIEELLNLINIIDKNENNNNKTIHYINKSKTNNNINKNKNNIIQDKSKVNANNPKIYYSKINNIKNNNMPKNKMLNKYNKNYKNVMKIEKKNKMLIENNKNNEVSKENNEQSKEFIENENSQEENKNIIHRKVNSTLIGNYLNKLELPSNSNVVSLLKNANETYADAYNKNSTREILYQTVKNTTGTEIKNSKNKVMNLQKFFNNKVNDKKYTNSNLMNKILCVENIISSPTNPKSRNNKLNKILKKIEIPKTYQKSNYCGINKRISPLPLSTRNNTSIVSIYEKKGTNANFNHSNTISDNKLFNNINNNTNSKCIFNTYKKKDEHKSIYANNPSFTGPYSKPKCIYKDKKIKGISAKQLFNKPNEITNIKKK